MKSNTEIKKDINKVLGMMAEINILISELSEDIDPREDAVEELIDAYVDYNKSKVHLIKAKRMLKNL